MAVIARILGVSILAAGVGVVLAQTLFGQYSDRTLAALVLGCVGALVGAVAGAAGEIVTATRQRQANEANRPG